MRRLAAAGMLHFGQEAREIYRSPALPLEPTAPEAGEARSARAILDAERALRMAKTLADGGFPEEAPALLAKSLREMTAALMAARGEALICGQGAVDSDIRRLVECGALPADALALLDATRSAPGDATTDEVARLLASTRRILTTVGPLPPIPPTQCSFVRVGPLSLET